MKTATTTPFNFKVTFDGKTVTEKTEIKKDGKPVTIKNPADLCNALKSSWMVTNDVNSFKQWAQRVNESKEHTVKFTKVDALQNMAQMFTLEVDDKKVNLYDYYLEHKRMNGASKLKPNGVTVKTLPTKVEQKVAQEPSVKAPAAKKDEVKGAPGSKRENRKRKIAAVQTGKNVAGKKSTVVKMHVHGKGLKKAVEKKASMKKAS